MDPRRSFQGLILALQRYWADYGCVILQPYDMEVGAGTFHPATTLRALGPKPWNATYVQPSRRPKDGRYGEIFERHLGLKSPLKLERRLNNLATKGGLHYAPSFS